MLTGDKLETALCIARSLQLGGGAGWHTARDCSSRRDAHALLQALHSADEDMDLIIEGETLEVIILTQLLFIMGLGALQQDTSEILFVRLR